MITPKKVLLLFMTVTYTAVLMARGHNYLGTCRSDDSSSGSDINSYSTPITPIVVWVSQQAQSQADQHGESEAANEGHQGADGAASPSKKRSLFKRGWGAGRKSNNEKKVKPNKSKLSEGSTALPQKSSGRASQADAC